jgi:hemolysin D
LVLPSALVAFMKNHQEFIVHSLDKTLDQTLQVKDPSQRLSREAGISRLVALLSVAIALTAGVYFIRQYLRQPLASLSLSEQSVALAKTEFTGKVQPATRFKMAALSSAIVKEVYVEVGDRVVAGQPLLVLENLEAKREYDQVKQQQEVAQQQILQLQAQIDSLTQMAALSDQMNQAEQQFSAAQLDAQQVPLYQRQDSVQRSQATYDLALAQYDRIKMLFAAGATSQADFDKASAELQIAEADLDSAQTAVAAAQTLKVEQQDRWAAQQQVNRAQQQQQIIQLKGQLKLAQLQSNQATQKLNLLLQQTGLPTLTGDRNFQLVVSATRDGAVVAVPASVGDQTYTGTSLIELSQIDRLNVEVAVSAQLVNSLQVGQLATVQVGSGTNASTFMGAILSVSPTPSENLHYSVKVQFRNPDQAILVGQPAKIRFDAR